MGGGGSSGPKYLDSVKVSSGNPPKINKNRYISSPMLIENFKGGKIRLLKTNNKNSLAIFTIIIILLLFNLYLFYLSRIKK